MFGNKFGGSSLADPDRYRVFFEMRGQRYRLRIEKM